MTRPDELSRFDKVLRSAALIVAALVLLLHISRWFLETIGENYRLNRENVYLRQEIDEWRKATKRLLEEDGEW